MSRSSPVRPTGPSLGWTALLTLLMLLLVPTGTAAATAWTPFDGGADTTCADGSEPTFLQRRADPERVVLYFEGGGACFSAETCAFDGPDSTYISTSLATADFLAGRGGMFDVDEPENPLAGHSFVYVPYCTGDAHLGDRTTRYSDELVVEHRGFVNGRAALDHVMAAYPELEELVVAGVSAGSIPTPLYAGLASDAFPDARIVSLGDGSGAFPSDPVLNAFVGSLWGAEAAIPDWPVARDLGVREWGVPDLYRYAGLHAPDVTFARFDYAGDETQAFYAALVGVPSDELLELMDRNEAGIETAGVNVASYVAPGSAHTILGSDAFYDLEVAGVRFVDWVTDLVGGATPPDVRCNDCD